MKRLTLITAASLLLLCSCRTLPPVEPGEAAKVSATADAALPQSFKAQQVLMFEFKPHWWWPTIHMTALGYATVNRKTGDYAVVCLTPVGVKLFEAKRLAGVTTVTVALPIKHDKEAMERAIGEDIESMYFGLTPPENADWRKDRRELSATSGDGAKREEWHFAADTGRLSRKEVQSSDGTRTILFSDYKLLLGGAYPALISIKNNRFRYTLSVQQSLVSVSK